MKSIPARKSSGVGSAGAWFDCSRCQDATGNAAAALLVVTIRDSEERGDLPILEFPVELIVARSRMARPNCGAKLKRLSWLGRLFAVNPAFGEQRGGLER
jgi:hypothetical protein